MSIRVSSFPTRSYRPLQCRTCKELLLNPVTLPCGFTVCQTCVPPAQTIAFQQQVRCPFRTCTRSNLHLPDQLTIDVTLQNLTTALRTAALHLTREKPSLCHPPDTLPADTLLHTSELTNHVRSSAVDSPNTFCESDAAETLVSHSTPPSVFYRSMPFIIDAIRPKIQQEIECQVCFLVFDQPITTYCGHTLCRSCLITSLDHKPCCPLCRRKLPLYMHYHNQAPNKALVRFIQYLASRPNASEADDIPPEDREIQSTLAMTPLFINSLIFPRMPCYLLVFEPRYRKLLRNVLKTESKLFGMVLPPQPQKGRTSETAAWEPSMEYGTLLKVLSCELLPDGRALVETVGVSRIQILTYSMMDGYYTATAIELVHDIPVEQEVGLERAALKAAMEAAVAREKAQRADEETSRRVTEKDGEQDEAEALIGTPYKQREDEDRSHSTAVSSGMRSLHRRRSPQPSSADSLTPLASEDDAMVRNGSLGWTQSDGGSRDLRLSAQELPERLNHLGLQDLHEVDLETLSRKQLMQILLGFVGQMQERLGPLATQRLQREFGEMIEDDGQAFSFWVASILPVRHYQKYELLRVSSVRQRLLMVLEWIKDIEARRSLAVCTIS